MVQGEAPLEAVSILQFFQLCESLLFNFLSRANFFLSVRAKVAKTRPKIVPATSWLEKDFKEPLLTTRRMSSPDLEELEQEYLPEALYVVTHPEN